MTKKSLTILIFVSSFLGIGHAALPPQKPAKMEDFQVVQRQIGGQAGSGFSLLNMQKIQAKNGVAERLVFDVGTKEGQQLKGLPGYFNAQNQVGPNRIVIDFSQMIGSKVDEKFIRGILKDSKLVKSVKITEDPEDKTLSMTLDLNAPVKMKTMQVAGKNQTAKVVLDIIKR
jgi:hypothetical protein